MATTLVRSTRDRRQANDWSLALSSQGISSRLVEARAEWHVWVADENAARALEALEAFERENEPRPMVPAPPEYGPTQVGFALSVAFVLFFGVTGPRDPAAAWFARGSADAAAIGAGEIWRAVTALTLHADWPHVLGNAVSCAVFATAVFRAWGPGAGGALLLLAGAGGNLANALYHVSHHSSVGASTALFGAIGILAGTQLVRRHRRGERRIRAWVPLAGALGLLAMLGTGERSDLFAHVFGLAAGAALGIGAGLWIVRPPSRTTQYSVGAITLASVALAWIIALDGPR